MQSSYLESRGAPSGRHVRHIVQLLDAFAEVCDPLDDGETGRHGVATPRAGDDTWTHTHQQSLTPFKMSLLK